jgi:hypothetical protein
MTMCQNWGLEHATVGKRHWAVQMIGKEVKVKEFSKLAMRDRAGYSEQISFDGLMRSKIFMRAPWWGCGVRG